MRSGAGKTPAPASVRLAPLVTFFALVLFAYPLSIRAASAPSQVPLPSPSPSSGWVFPQGTSSFTLPAHFLPYGDIVVRMTVKGRGLDLSLDTGMSYNALDSSIFSSMDLGQASVVFDTVSFGSAQMRRLPFNEGNFYRHAKDGSLIVGLLGYDFLKQSVVEIDYDDQLVRIIQPRAFRAPADSIRYQLYSDDTVPLVTAKLGSAEGGSFVIDTGATTVVVFPRFVDNNPAGFTSSQELTSNQQFHYFQFFWPLCGRIEMHPYSVNEMSVETLGVRNWVVWAVPPGSCFALKRLDGLIGYDFLRFFNVYIDYPQNLVILEPNEVYQNAPNTLKR